MILGGIRFMARLMWWSLRGREASHERSSSPRIFISGVAGGNRDHRVALGAFVARPFEGAAAGEADGVSGDAAEHGAGGGAACGGASGVSADSGMAVERGGRGGQPDGAG